MDTALTKLEKKEEAIKENLDKGGPKATKWVELDSRTVLVNNVSVKHSLYFNVLRTFMKVNFAWSESKLFKAFYSNL